MGSEIPGSRTRMRRVLPPGYWSNAVIGKYYRLLKTQISFRIDNEVLDCHLSRINEILRDRMARER